MDFYRGRVVDGLGQVIHEKLFAVEIPDYGNPVVREPSILGGFVPASPPDTLPSIATKEESPSFVHEQVLQPFLQETRQERLAEIGRIAEHIELSLTELLQKVDEEIGRASAEVDDKVPGAEGR